MIHFSKYFYCNFILSYCVCCVSDKLKDVGRERERERKVVNFGDQVTLSSKQLGNNVYTKVMIIVEYGKMITLILPPLSLSLVPF